jgi:hypothetical protein
MQNNELLLTDDGERQTNEMHFQTKLMLRYGLTRSAEPKRTNQTTSTSPVYFENALFWSFIHHNL